MRYTDVAERCTLTWQLPIRQFGKKTSCMEARPKGPSAFLAPGGKNKWVFEKDGASKY